MIAAAGHSNREVAQSLFVSRKTVEMPLTQAFAKLEIGPRSELPGALDIEAPGGQDASEGKVQG